MTYTKKGHDHKGTKNPMWRGGKPKCKFCKIVTGSYESKTCRSCWRKNHKGSNCYQWKGNNVSYSALHKWINKNFIRTDVCDFCHKHPGNRVDGRTKLQWSNISKNYLRDRTDWYCLCVRCHCYFDGIWGKKKKLIVD